jgi:hypothetical protein
MRVVGKTSTIRWRKFYLAAARFGRRFQTKPKWWPSAKTDDGAKGQQPTQGRAGAGLASPAGIEAGANAIHMARSSDNSPAIYGWVIVQPIQRSPGRDERKPANEKVLSSLTGLWTLPKREPSHKWLGYFQTLFNSTRARLWWPGARTGAKGQRPTHGRAGVGLASPAGTGADVCANGKSVGLESL